MYTFKIDLPIGQPLVVGPFEIRATEMTKKNVKYEVQATSKQPNIYYRDLPTGGKVLTTEPPAI